MFGEGNEYLTLRDTHYEGDLTGPSGFLWNTLLDYYDKVTGTSDMFPYGKPIHTLSQEELVIRDILDRMLTRLENQVDSWKTQPKPIQKQTITLIAPEDNQKVLSTVRYRMLAKLGFIKIPGENVKPTNLLIAPDWSLPGLNTIPSHDYTLSIAQPVTFEEWNDDGLIQSLLTSHQAVKLGEWNKPVSYNTLRTISRNPALNGVIAEFPYDTALLSFSFNQQAVQESLGQ